MSDSRESEIQQEIEKISEDIKSIMKKVEALYPKEQAGEKEGGSEQAITGKSDDAGEN